MPKEQSDAAASDAAVDVARAAAVEVAGAATVGEFLGSQDEAEVLGALTSYHFESLQPGYGGWFWSVSATDANGAVTVNDVVLLPGGDAIVAPTWTPYRERILPGDLGPGDLLPPEDDDLRLVPAWSAGDSQDTVDRYFAREVGLGRTHVLSLVGRDLAADRWHDSPEGPDNPITEQAPGTCSTCGFLLSLAGPLSQTFGVCANADANSDGRAVALTHGCGAHSAAKLKRSAAPDELPPPVFDTVAIDPLDLSPVAEPVTPEADTVAVDDLAEDVFTADEVADEGADEGADQASADIDGIDDLPEVEDMSEVGEISEVNGLPEVEDVPEVEDGASDDQAETPEPADA
jgi:hypothetical protein